MAILDPEYLEAIKGFEGYAPQAQWDFKQYSSGYGTKAQPGDASIPADQLKSVYEQRYQDEIANAAAHVDQVNPNLPAGARAALVSLTYNAGPGWSNSGLGDLVRKGDLEGAQAKLLEYNKAGGEVNPGLVARRAKEAAWFGGNIPTAAKAAPTTAGKLPATSSVNLASLEQPSAPQPQAAPDSGGGYFAAMPAEQFTPLPIFTPPRQRVDLTKLKAALASGNQGYYFGKS